MTREEFWHSPLGIIFIGLIVGVVAVLLIRLIIRACRSQPADPHMAAQGKARAKPLNFPEQKR